MPPRNSYPQRKYPTFSTYIAPAPAPLLSPSPIVTSPSPVTLPETVFESEPVYASPSPEGLDRQLRSARLEKNTMHEEFNDLSPRASPGMLSTPSPIDSSLSSEGREFGAQSISSDVAFGTYVKTRKDFLDVLKDLHATGIQNELGDLPQIVVIGSQSVGKSSLIESMSGLSLPRDTGTCTRCPMECRLQTGPSWSCQITLRFTLDSQGQPLADVNRVSFGEILHDKSEVQEMLRRAQRAILRPNLHHTLFLTDSDLKVEGPPAQSFSANCVCVDIAGPNVPDLYFYDLPGLIANVSDGGDPNDIALIDKLAEDYIKRPNCIVLLVISCESDFENQKAGHLVMRDPDLKRRAIGVLTKVDRIERGAASRWLSILKGETNVLTKGWYCVKQPDLVQIADGLSREAARNEEKAYFTFTEPWSKVASQDARRIGSDNLAECLGLTLSGLVADELPRIYSKVDEAVTGARKELSRIAPLTANPIQEVSKLFSSFFRDLSNHLAGRPSLPLVDAAKLPSEAALWNQLHVVFEGFRKKIQDTAPQFRPWRSNVNEGSAADELRQELCKIDATTAGDATNGMYADEILAMAKHSRTRELPGSYPFTVNERLIKQSTSHWRDIARDCFDEIERAVQTHLDTLVEFHFGKYKRGGLHETIRSIVLAELRSRFKRTAHDIDLLSQNELVPYTQNEHYYFHHFDKYLMQYRLIHERSKKGDTFAEAIRLHASAPSSLSSERRGYINNIISNFASLGAHGIAATHLARILPMDQYDPALRIMAEVRSYFQVAYKRFIDNIPTLVDAEFIRGLDYALDDKLRVLLTEKTESECGEWLMESPELEKDRKELQGKKARLEAALKQLSAFNLRR